MKKTNHGAPLNGTTLHAVPQRILCVDDERNVLKSLSRVFEDREYEILTAGSGPEGLDILRRVSPVQVVITDYKMPSMNGVEFLKEVFLGWPHTVRMVLSGHADTSALISAINEGMVYRFILKPWNNDELRVTVSNALERYNLVEQKNLAEQALKDHLSHLEEIVRERTGQLEKVNDEFRSVMARLAEAEETERRTISRELHDRIGQNLNTVGLILNIVKQLVPETRVPPARAHIDDCLKIIKETSKAMRDLLTDLRAPVLEDYGLMVALQWYAQQYALRTGINVFVEGDDITPRPPDHIETAFYRIALEALTNVSKHARATKVVITVSLKERRLFLSVADNGIGYRTGHEADTRAPRGLGLLTMSERAVAVGGKCRTRSKPGSGTEVIAEVQI